MTISQLARSIAESPTLKMNEEARLLRERGESVIHLGIGEPKNKTPFPALLSAAAKLNTGDIKYSPTDGIPTLKKAIVRYTEENYDRLVAPENIIVSSGAKQSLFNIFYALLDPNDEVLILAPYWVSYPEMVKMVRGVPVIVTPEDGGFHPRLADIERAVSSSTKAIVVNSPNNPSGVMYTEEFMADIVAFCEKKNIYLILDDIYHKLVFNKRKWSPAYKFTDQDVESGKIIVVNGIAKAYGMTGFRIGWCIANRKLVEVMTNIQGQITTCAALVSQAAAEGALNGLQSVVDSLRLTIENNRAVALTELGAFTGVRCVPPDGTFYCLPDFRAYSNNSVELANFLLKMARVVTVPGKEFGMEGHLRLSYAGTVKDVTEGIARIRWALDPDAPSEIYIGDKKMVRDWM
jgi:aspartate aminotransferase